MFVCECAFVVCCVLCVWPYISSYCIEPTDAVIKNSLSLHVEEYYGCFMLQVVSNISYYYISPERVLTHLLHWATVLILDV